MGGNEIIRLNRRFMNKQMQDVVRKLQPWGCWTLKNILENETENREKVANKMKDNEGKLNHMINLEKN